MPILNKINLDQRDGLALWYVCAGQLHVWDRGDGMAEVSRFEFPSGEDAIGYVRGDPQPEQNETGYLEVRSAFPGVWCQAGKESVAVETVEALESVLWVMVNLETSTTNDSNYLDDDEMAQIGVEIEREKKKTFQISHRYDIGNQTIYVERKSGDVDATRAAVYCLFKFEEWYGVEASISNFGIAALLMVFYGFRHTAVTPIHTKIDLYSDRSRMCGPGSAELLNDESLFRTGLRDFMAPFID